MKSSFSRNGGVFVPKWEENISVSSHEDLNKNFQAPFFKGAGLDPQLVNLPVKEILVPVEPGEEIVLVSASANNAEEVSTDLFRESVREAKIDFEDDWYPARNAAVGARVSNQGKEFQYVYIYPVQVSRMGNTLRKAESVSYQISRRRMPAAKSGFGTTSGPARRNFASNSVLASGSWYKMGITSGGVYKIDYDYLNSIGVNPSSIDPRTIRVHGNGGGMLPQEAGVWDRDDLVENSIVVVGEADGSFDQGDYVLFYGESPHTWFFHPTFDQYFHRFNIYSDTAFYFMTWGNGNGKRVQSVPSDPGTNFTPDHTRKFTFFEEDKFNALLSGRVWLGDNFDFTTERTYSFNVPNLQANSDIKVTTRLAARSNSGSSFAIREGNNLITNLAITNVNTQIYGSYYYRANHKTFAVPSSLINDGSLDLEFAYNKPLSSSVGYLDYIEMEYLSRLNTGGAKQWIFSATDNVGPGQVFDYRIDGGSNSHRIWDISDVTNVRQQSFTLSGSQMRFGVKADSVKRFVAFTTDGAKTPVSVKAIGNQNLHALPAADYIIITHSDFTSSANNLAQFHRDQFGRTVHVVNARTIYNEFSSGALDPTAIRDFLKMFYDRHNGTTDQLRYVLMFGDGSYDYKNRVTSNETNFVPTYQSRKSQRPTESYTSDDFFGFLEDGEGFWGERAGLEAGAIDLLYYVEGDTVTNTHHLDISIGRFPVSTVEQADGLVSKVINYHTNPSSLGPWRNKIVLVADHKDTDGVIHISQSNSFSGDIYDANPCINIDKVFMDNYDMANTASGARFPDGKAALLKSLDEGSLLVNYTGHGGEIGWSNASILDISDINNIENGFRLPAYVTATCEFGRWDDPTRVSGAETVFLRPDGGSIAMFTTVRVVFSGPNYVLNQNFYKYAFERDTVENRYMTMGEIFRLTKNDSWLNAINNRNFTLMGDPGLPLAYPELKTEITTINGISAVDTIIDSLGALSLVTIAGRVTDQQGNFIPTFNGDLNMTVFDKPTKFTTKRFPYNFFWQKNKVFNGKGTVTNGEFSFQFVVPIDISYEDGNGKISLYANNGSTDAAGCNTNIYIGGGSGSAITDDIGPELDVFMNDEKFADGNMVDPNPLMIAEVYDENGINTVGTGIGHELTGILDERSDEVIVLNDFYTADKNSYQRGSIEYPFSDLEIGEHKLQVKVWDVANNSSEKTINFIVADDASMALGHVLNYPNPFTTNTKFFIEHNLNGRFLNVRVKIFTVSGRMVKSLEDSFLADGNLYCDLEWDGLDEYGDALGRGVYVYQVSVTDNESGEKIDKFEKLVMLR